MTDEMRKTKARSRARENSPEGEKLIREEKNEETDEISIFYEIERETNLE